MMTGPTSSDTDRMHSDPDGLFWTDLMRTTVSTWQTENTTMLD